MPSHTLVDNVYLFGVLTAFVSVILMSISMIIIRKVKDTNYAILTFYFSWVAFLETGLLTALLNDYTLPTTSTEWLSMAGMAIFAAISRFCLIIALQKEDALPIGMNPLLVSSNTGPYVEYNGAAAIVAYGQCLRHVQLTHRHICDPEIDGNIHQLFGPNGREVLQLLDITLVSEFANKCVFKEFFVDFHRLGGPLRLTYPCLVHVRRVYYYLHVIYLSDGPLEYEPPLEGRYVGFDFGVNAFSGLKILNRIEVPNSGRTFACTGIAGKLQSHSTHITTLTLTTSAPHTVQRSGRPLSGGLLSDRID
ncbi:unnamed protein product, partial [Oppiella nova]